MHAFVIILNSNGRRRLTMTTGSILTRIKKYGRIRPLEWLPTMKFNASHIEKFPVSQPHFRPSSSPSIQLQNPTDQSTPNFARMAKTRHAPDFSTANVRNDVLARRSWPDSRAPRHEHARFQKPPLPSLLVFPFSYQLYQGSNSRGGGRRDFRELLYISIDYYTCSVLTDGDTTYYQELPWLNSPAPKWHTICIDNCQVTRSLLRRC